MGTKTFMQRAAAATLGALAFAGCAIPVDNPPVYDSQRFLCTDEHSDVLREAIETCRDAFELDGSCAGILSFSGQLEGEPITVESVLDSSEFVDLRTSGEGSEVRQELKLSGKSPYFSFVFSWLDIGGDLAGGAEDRALRFGATEDGELPLEDDRVAATLRMSVGGESKAFTPREGELLSEVQRAAEQAATFSADFGASGDYVEGCFHAFATNHKFTLEATSDAR